MIVTFNQCLNAEHKLYGLSVFGLIFAGLIGLFIWMRFGMTTGLISMIIAYGISAYFGKKWHTGEMQRTLYGKFSFKGISGAKHIPESYEKCFF